MDHGTFDMYFWNIPWYIRNVPCYFTMYRGIFEMYHVTLKDVPWKCTIVHLKCNMVHLKYNMVLYYVSWYISNLPWYILRTTMVHCECTIWYNESMTIKCIMLYYLMCWPGGHYGLEMCLITSLMIRHLWGNTIFRSRRLIKVIPICH